MKYCIINNCIIKYIFSYYPIVQYYSCGSIVREETQSTAVSSPSPAPLYSRDSLSPLLRLTTNSLKPRSTQSPVLYTSYLVISLFIFMVSYMTRSEDCSIKHSTFIQKNFLLISGTIIFYCIENKYVANRL